MSESLPAPDSAFDAENTPLWALTRTNSCTHVFFILVVSLSARRRRLRDAALVHNARAARRLEELAASGGQIETDYAREVATERFSLRRRQD